MAKNNKLINSIKEIAARNREENIRVASEKDTVQIYAALAMALWNTLDMPDSEKADAIETVFEESQSIWMDCIEKGYDMDKKCLELTGIDVRNGVECENGF